MNYDGTYPALFHNSLSGAPYIEVYTNYMTLLGYMYYQSYLIGGILHELGHYSHYSLRGGYSMFQKVPKLVTESYACYVGWYLGELYYTRLGYVETVSDEDITYQARQIWRKTDIGTNAPYSPLFVDLIDDFNQYAYYGPSANLVQDLMSGVPHSVINRVACQGWEWAKCKSILQEYVGTYYNAVDFNYYIGHYDYWFARN